MSICIGTTKEEAFQNRAPRDSLVNSKELEELYTTFKLEDGCTVTIDRHN